MQWAPIFGAVELDTYLIQSFLIKHSTLHWASYTPDLVLYDLCLFQQTDHASERDQMQRRNSNFAWWKLWHADCVRDILESKKMDSPLRICLHFLASCDSSTVNTKTWFLSRTHKTMTHLYYKKSPLLESKKMDSSCGHVFIFLPLLMLPLCSLQLSFSIAFINLGLAVSVDSVDWNRWSQSPAYPLTETRLPAELLNDVRDCLTELF